MKHIKDPYEKKNTIVVLSKEEIDIIGAALNNRMVYLGKIRKSCIAQREENDAASIYKAWCKTLDLQCEWFEIEKEN